MIKKHTDQSFTNFVRTIRLFEVKRLLVNTAYSLSKISEMVGYSDASNLVKAFKKECGLKYIKRLLREIIKYKNFI